MSRVSIHNHTQYSNIRLLDAISDPKELIDRAIELGMQGIAITEHGNVCSAPLCNFYEEEIHKTNPDFKVILGMEGYLTDDREPKQQYYHTVYLAKNAIGHKMIRELSSLAWINGFTDRGMFRIPNTRKEVEDIILKYGKGNIIMTQSCISGRVNYHLNKMIEATANEDYEAQVFHYNIIDDFMNWADKWFGDDFYLEVAPATYPEQIAVNSRMLAVSKAYNKKIVIGDDAHRVRKEDFIAHEAFLNSQGGEREVMDFYQFTYLQSDEECKEHLKDTGLDFNELVAASEEIYNKVESFSLRNKQHIPKMQVSVNYPIGNRVGNEKYPVLTSLLYSQNEVERYWVNECINKLESRNLVNDDYMSELEYEADIMKYIGDNLGTCIFEYPVFLQHYIDLFWECGSCVGVARGSGGAGLNHWLLGITQIDPVKYNLPYFRFLNKERTELPKQ